MSVVFVPGQVLARGDLDIFLTNSQGHVTNASEISFALYWVDPGPPEAEVLIGSAARTPVNPAVGEYYASLMIPAGATTGDKRIRWTLRELVNSPQQQIVQEFGVVAAGGAVVTPAYSDQATAMIGSLRMLLRDQAPDRNYHFRPPEHESSVGQYNQVFGQIWEDNELYEYINRALDWFNMFPPSTAEMSTIEMMFVQKPQWRTAILWDAITHACFALAANWVSDEFSYSIGGISLDIERSSKYEALKQNAEQQFDKAIEAKKATVHYVRGL
jgi:hypothetical protein